MNNEKSISWQVAFILGVIIVVAGVLTYYEVISVGWFEKLIILIIGSIIGGVVAFGYYLRKLARIR